MKGCKFNDDKDIMRWQIAGSKINNFSAVETELSRIAGPSAFHLKETTLKSDEI